MLSYSSHYDMATFLKEFMVSWRTELTSCGGKLGLVDIRRGTFQRDSLSSLIIAACMNPSECQSLIYLNKSLVPYG